MPQPFSPPRPAPLPKAQKAKEPPADFPQGVDEIADSRTPSPAFLNQKLQGQSASSILNTTSGDSETTRCLRGRQASVLLISWDRGFPPGTLTKQELENQQGGEAQVHHPLARRQVPTSAASAGLQPLGLSEKVGLKLNIQKTKIMASHPITSWEIDGETVETVSDFIFWGSKITTDGDCSHEIKRHLLLGSGGSRVISLACFLLWLPRWRSGKEST